MHFNIKRYFYGISKRRFWLLLILFPPMFYIFVSAGYADRFSIKQNISTSKDLQFVFGKADAAYGKLLTKFHRYLTLVDCKFVVIVDDLTSEEIRKIEWLMHYDGEVSEDQSGIFNIANGKVSFPAI